MTNKLSKVDKAAILLLSLGESDAAQVLQHMGPKEVQRVGSAMAQMRNVQRDQVEQVMTEFVEIVSDQTGLGIGSDELQVGDELYVQSIDVLADSMTQAVDLFRLFARDEVTVYLLDEQWTNRDSYCFNLLEWTERFTDWQVLFLRHASTFAAKEAKRKGRPVGRPRKSDDMIHKAFAMYDSKQYTLHEIKKETGISKSTLYRYLDTRR